MRRALLCIVIGVSLVSATRAQTPQTPARDQQAPRPASATPAPRGRAVISGVVSSGDASAQPIRMATVVLIGQLTGTLKVTMTDASGAFAFHDLAADRYLVGAGKRPYIGAVAGATRPARPGAPVVVADGQAVANVAIKLTPGAAIGGTILDDRGRPAPDVAVAVRQWRTRGGERSLTNVPNGVALTDDRGMYRFFGLAPGQYIVYAQARPAPMSVPLHDADVDRALAGGPVAAMPAASTQEYAPIYAPGSTLSLADAMTIDLSPGDDRESVDLQLTLARLVKIEGTLSFANGDAVTGGAFSVVGDDTNPIGRLTTVAPGGHFQAVLPPGRQTIQFLNRGVRSSGTGIGTIDVGDADQSGVQVELQAGLVLGGHLAFEGAAPPPLAGRSIPLHAVSAQAEAAHRTPLVQTNQTGSFTASNLFPGQYVISGPMSFGATTDSMKWTIKSVVAGGRDLTDLPIVLSPDAAAPEIVVTMTDVWQSVSGKIQGAPASAPYTVVVFPSDRQYWLGGSRRIRTTRAAADGSFAIGGPGTSSLPPGSYLLAVVTDIDRDEEFDPTFLDSIVGAATTVGIASGANVTQDVRIR
jgi:hypothetical protein